MKFVIWFMNSQKKITHVCESYRKSFPMTPICIWLLEIILWQITSEYKQKQKWRKKWHWFSSSRVTHFFISNEMNLGRAKKIMNECTTTKYTMWFAPQPAFNCNLYTIFHICICCVIFAVIAFCLQRNCAWHQCRYQTQRREREWKKQNDLSLWIP